MQRLQAPTRIALRAASLIGQWRTKRVAHELGGRRMCSSAEEDVGDPQLVVVRNISLRATRDDVQKLMSIAGNVMSIAMYKDSEGKLTGTAAVKMDSPQSAKEAVLRLCGSLFMGRRLRMKLDEGLAKHLEHAALERRSVLLWNLPESVSVQDLIMLGNTYGRVEDAQVTVPRNSLTAVAVVIFTHTRYAKLMRRGVNGTPFKDKNIRAALGTTMPAQSTLPPGGSSSDPSGA